MTESEVMDPVSGIYGRPWKVITCRGIDRQGHEPGDCEACGGSGYRAICNLTDCHEHGCSWVTCARTRKEYENQQKRRAQAGEGGEV